MDYGGFINLSFSNSFYFTNASNNDTLIYPETSNQSFHIGITSNAASLLSVNSNMITLNASNLIIKGPITTNNNLTYAPVDYGVSNLSIPGCITGTIPVSASNPFNITNEGSLYLSGTTGNYMTIQSQPVSASLPDTTIETWIYQTANQTSAYFTNPPYLIGNYGTGSGSGMNWAFGINSINQLSFYSFNGIHITGPTITNNTWNHIAFSYSSASKAFSIFLNGTIQTLTVTSGVAGTTGTGTTATIITNGVATSSSMPIIIGQYNGVPISNTYITSLRWTNGIVYTGNFTLSNTPLLPAPTGTTALLLRTPQNPGRVLIPKIGGIMQVQAYPPAAMTDYFTNIQNTSYGAGTYIVSASAQAHDGLKSFYAFDYSSGSRWTSYNWQASAASASYTGQTNTVDIYKKSYMGEWIQIYLPVSINISSVYLNPFMANLIYLLGSVDGINWYPISTQNLNGSALTFTTTVVMAFNYFRIVLNTASNTNGFGTAGFFDIVLYGTQESVSITPDGQVGIGVTQPVQQLEVAGNAMISGNISANNLGMFRNRIINGDIQVNQRGVTSSNYTGTTSRYVCDRYYLENLNVNANSIINITQNSLISSDTPYQLGFNNSLKITINGNDATAGSRWFGGLCQNIEGYNISDFGLGTVYSSPFTVSGWFRSSMSNNSTVTLATRTFSGATAYSYLTNVNVAGSNNWQYLKTTIPPLVISGSIITTSNNALQLFLAPTVAGGSTNTTNSWIGNATYVSSTTTNWATTVGNWVEFTGIQLEKGTVATPFEFRNYARELKLCQRYYWQQANLFYVSALSTTSTDPRVWIKHPTNMRIAPTITGTSANIFFANNITTMGFQCGDSNSAGAFGTITAIYANAEL